MAFTPQIIRRDTVDSTNSEVARLAQQGAEEGTCVLADQQTAGRGRLQRQWISPEGAGIYFSILLRPVFAIDRWPLLTLMAAIAVHDTLRETCALTIDIKWPNDILTNERKLCGILAETIDTKDGRALVVGIGINVSAAAFPPEIADRAISIQEATSKIPDRELILQRLVKNIVRYYKLLNTNNGNAQIVDAWSSRSSYAYGKSVRVSANEEIIHGVTRGLEGDGALRVETDEGEIKVVHAGDVVAVRPGDRTIP